MAEVFSIAGAYLGQQAPCPPGWQQTPNGNCGAPVATCPGGMKVKGACRSPVAQNLQRALNTHGAALQVDGIVGPKTAGAVNRILPGLPNAPKALGTGSLSVYDVARSAVAITAALRGTAATQAIEEQAAANQATVPTPTPSPTTSARGTCGVLCWGLIGLTVTAAAVGLYATARV